MKRTGEIRGCKRCRAGAVWLIFELTTPRPADLRARCYRGTSITSVFSDLKMLPVPQALSEKVEEWILQEGQAFCSISDEVSQIDVVQPGWSCGPHFWGEQKKMRLRESNSKRRSSKGERRPPCSQLRQMLGWQWEAIARGLLCTGQSQETDNVRLMVVRTGGVGL